jgi:hypothetical protein
MKPAIIRLVGAVLLVIMLVRYTAGWWDAIPAGAAWAKFQHRDLQNQKP